MNVTIVGGGFGGVKTALELARNPRNEITLISDHEDFQYYPALYSTATGHSHFESWIALGEIFAGKNNVQVCIDAIETIDPSTKQLKGASGTIYEYKTCVLALGSVTTYFGIEGLDTYAYGIKSEAEIKRLKQHIYEDVAEHGQLDSHYVIVGGGPTGVELAASLGEYLTRLTKRYHVKRHGVHISLVEASPRLLPRSAEITSHKVLRRLKNLGIRVETGKMVQSANDHGLIVSGRPIESSTVIWTSGVANNPFFEANKEHFEFAKNHRIIVDEHMMAAPDVYVIGDNAASKYGGLALTAVRDAKFVAKHLARKAKRQKLHAYKQKAPATVIPVGGWWAAFEWKGLRLYGWPAGIIRRAADLVGYHDILPLGQALSKLQSGELLEDDYFTPSPDAQKHAYASATEPSPDDDTIKR